ncbi:glucosaminidase domain-containing protein [Flavobacterium agrisoli]|uniref:Peptidoglycan hydrolase n=1 Tax=Flavobacterium agrisoli TaxID=2793066 RepID=A0A934PMD8_9FLAO|nr:glucosaminidase domain-containing protein [Flavobacterium agrisoli]MBK0369954.1 glucosaminidase domain-containing protein [Flavobacterium agrisoli]
MYSKILLLLIAISLVSCHASKPTIVTSKSQTSQKQRSVVQTTKKPTYSKSESNIPASTKNQNQTTTEVIESTSRTVVSNDVIDHYIAAYKDVAMGNMKTYGIPASIILAQGILESGAGKGDLALTANNHFGIKCHNDWLGESVRHDDDASQECFRKYNDASESFRDHALFLTGKKRYASLFQYEKDDYKAWAKGLRAAGYATDPRYPDKLMSYIERYQLHQYDAQVLGKKYDVSQSQAVLAAYKSTPNNPNFSYYEVQKGDTLYSISKKFNILIDDIKKNNNLSDNTLSIGQKLIVK